MAPKTDPFGIVRPLGHSRRALMLGGGAACVTGLLRINLPGRAQSAACGRVVVGTWGGDYANFLDTYLHHQLQSGAGLEVATDLGPASPRKSKLLAERNRPQGSVDIVCLDQTDMYQMARQGVLQDLSSGDVPNAARVIEPLRKAYSVPHVYSARVIVYNPEKMPKPGSYRDLWHPDCAGKIGFADLLAVSVLESAALAWGGGPSDYEPGKAKLLELKKTGVRLYPSNEALAAALKFGEIWATVMWRARAYQWRRAGIAVESAVPEEGATPITFEAGLAKNSIRSRKWALRNRWAICRPSLMLFFRRISGRNSTSPRRSAPASSGKTCNTSIKTLRLSRIGGTRNSRLDQLSARENTEPTSSRWRCEWSLRLRPSCSHSRRICLRAR